MAFFVKKCMTVKCTFCYFSAKLLFYVCYVSLICPRLLHAGSLDLITDIQGHVEYGARD